MLSDELFEAFALCLARSGVESLEERLAHINRLNQFVGMHSECAHALKETLELENKT